MSEAILSGRGRDLVSILRSTWEEQLSQVPRETATALEFMTRDHHRVRYFVVQQLVRSAQPIAPRTISERLNLTHDRVDTILRELERNLFFLVRNTRGEVSWAFPVTAEETPHRLEFDSGERLWAA